VPLTVTFKYHHVIKPDMDVKKAIEKTRSVRKYQTKKIPSNLIEELIDAARLAPSGNNAQPWKYKVIASEKEKALLKENKIFKQDFVYKAPVIILCCADPEAYPKAEFEQGFDDAYELRALRDLAISSQNLILRATELGLGTCYVGWMNKPKTKEIFGLPERYVIPYFITLGYPADKPKTKSRKRTEEILL